MLDRLPASPVWRKLGLYQLAGGCGALGVASLVLLAIAGEGQIAWMMFLPFLIAIFFVIVAVVLAIAWMVAALSSELNSVAATNKDTNLLRWPRHFPWTKWLLGRCFIIAAAAIAVCLWLAWSGAAIWKSWNTPEITFVAVGATAAAIACTLWAEALYWLVLNWRKGPPTAGRMRSHTARRSKEHRMEEI